VKVSLPNVWQKVREKKLMNEKKKERKRYMRRRKKKTWVCIKWTPRFSKVH
jgi:hypothetical protein